MYKKEVFLLGLFLPLLILCKTSKIMLVNLKTRCLHPGLIIFYTHSLTPRHLLKQVYFCFGSSLSWSQLLEVCDKLLQGWAGLQLHEILCNYKNILKHSKALHKTEESDSDGFSLSSPDSRCLPSLLLLSGQQWVENNACFVSNWWQSYQLRGRRDCG